MARKSKDQTPTITKRATEIGSGINAMMNRLYGATYMTSPRTGADLASVTKDIDASLDRITSSNVSATGIPNISQLYSRLDIKKTQSDKDTIDAIDSMFNDSGIMDSVLGAYMQNKYLKDFDNEIDTICKYMPRLLEALETRKDNVLSADHFSKDFIMVKNRSVKNNDETFDDQVAQLKEKYHLAEQIEESYMIASKYGEQYIYNVPYTQAINKLLQTKGDTKRAILKVDESCKVIREGFIGVEDTYSTYFPKDTNTSLNAKSGLDGKREFKIELCRSNILESAVEDVETMYQKFGSVTESSLNMQILSEAGKQQKFDTVLGDKINLDGLDDTASDGLIDMSKTNDANKQFVNDNLPGSVVKVLERTQVIPIYIEDLCLGYYYIEFKDNFDEVFNFSSQLSDPIASLKRGTRTTSLEDNIQQDNMIKYISSQLSSLIDANFVNANQDLRKEIYMILKHNDVYNSGNASSIKVTFIPPEDMIHVYFNQNKKDHRGVSDLEKALIPAKLYSCLYITNVLTILTRGSDKRVYYVKNQVDTNTSKVLLNTINQIKKSNFGIRQIENINTVLNITGRFNDYVIPRGPSGDSPIDFEVMPGQNVDVKTELMTVLEEIAINSTDVPLELIQARQSIDYSSQLTMSNSKFLRKVYNRQAKYERILSRWITKLFNSEFKTNYELEVTLPPPMFLNIANTNQLITNTKDYVESLFDIETSNEDDDIFKNIYKKDLIEYHLGSHLNVSAHKDIWDRAKIKAATLKASSSEGEEPSEE